MSLTINKAAYEKLIAENLEWLLAQPRTLERDHIEQIVRNSTAMHYPAKELLIHTGHLAIDNSIALREPFQPGDRVRVVKIEEAGK